jgi:hypothetical protein
MSELVVQGPTPEIVMDNNPSPEADKTPEASPDAPFTRFIELDGRSPAFENALTWPETQRRIQALLKRGLQQDRDFENRWPAALDTRLER